MGKSSELQPNILPTCNQTLIIYSRRIIHCAYWRAKSHTTSKKPNMVLCHSLKSSRARTNHKIKCNVETT